MRGKAACHRATASHRRLAVPAAQTSTAGPSASTHLQSPAPSAGPTTCWGHRAVSEGSGPSAQHRLQTGTVQGLAVGWVCADGRGQYGTAVCGVCVVTKASAGACRSKSMAGQRVRDKGAATERSALLHQQPRSLTQGAAIEELGYDPQRVSHRTLQQEEESGSDRQMRYNGVTSSRCQFMGAGSVLAALFPSATSSKAWDNTAKQCACGESAGSMGSAGRSASSYVCARQGWRENSRPSSACGWGDRWAPRRCHRRWGAAHSVSRSSRRNQR